MLEITTTRHNPLIDPRLSVWGWEIPVYLFLGGMVAGMMVLAGYHMLKVARGESRDVYAVQTPILAFLLINLGMGALFLDLAHKLYVWRVYMTFEPTSPMSWGSWVLLLVYGVVAASALIRLDEAWPWLARQLPQIGKASRYLLDRPHLIRLLAGLNIAFGIALGIYTGILLSTMVARPLWNTALLGPLFLVSGLSAACAMVHLLSVLVPARRPAPQGLVSGAWSALIQPLTPDYPPKASATSLVRFDQMFLVTELALIALIFIGLLSSSAAHADAAKLLLTGRSAWLFWGITVAAGIVVPYALQALELRHRIAHTIVPALLVLVGGFALRWVLVDAGQASRMLPMIGLGQ